MPRINNPTENLPRDSKWNNKPHMSKRAWPGSFAVPMQMSTPMYRNTSSYRKRRKTSNSGFVQRSGPYRVLTSGRRHTNSTYPRPEVKYFDSSQVGVQFVVPSGNTGINMPNGGTCVSLLQHINKGLLANQRVGNRFATKSVSYRFEVDLPVTTSTPAGTPVQCSGRVVLVWDKQPNAAVANWAQVFQFASYLSFMDVGNADRYTVLRNQQFNLSPMGDQTLFFEGFCKINMDTIWPAGAADDTPPTTGDLLLLYISDQNVVTAQPRIQGLWRVRYIDS